MFHAINARPARTIAIPIGVTRRMSATPIARQKIKPSYGRVIARSTTPMAAIAPKVLSFPADASNSAPPNIASAPPWYDSIHSSMVGWIATAIPPNSASAGVVQTRRAHHIAAHAAAPMIHTARNG